MKNSKTMTAPLKLGKGWEVMTAAPTRFSSPASAAACFETELYGTVRKHTQAALEAQKAGGGMALGGGVQAAVARVIGEGMITAAVAMSRRVAYDNTVVPVGSYVPANGGVFLFAQTLSLLRVSFSKS